MDAWNATQHNITGDSKWTCLTIAECEMLLRACKTSEVITSSWAKRCRAPRAYLWQHLLSCRLVKPVAAIGHSVNVCMETDLLMSWDRPNGRWWRSAGQARGDSWAQHHLPSRHLDANLEESRSFLTSGITLVSCLLLVNRATLWTASSAGPAGRQSSWKLIGLYEPRVSRIVLRLQIYSFSVTMSP